MGLKLTSQNRILSGQKLLSWFCEIDIFFR